MPAEERMCPICGGGGYLVHKGTRDNDAINVYRCPECGTRFLSVIDIDYDYENGFMHKTGVDLEIDIETKLRLHKPDDDRRFDMVRSICAGKRVMDFGCGYGGFLKNIKRIASECCGVELGKEEREYVGGIGIKCYKDIDESSGIFDVITLFHVFEHLSDPEKWLNKIGQHLRPGGTLIIEVPNADDVLLSLYESEAFADFTYWSAHLFLYTIKSLTMIIERCGKFRIVSPGQMQRYPLANHLMWLAKGKPGGHEKWSQLDSAGLDREYENKLKELQKCDTLFFVLEKSP